jgi:hypothetical protein
MQKESFIINRNTLLHVSTLPGHLQGELFRYRYTKVAFYSCTLWSRPALPVQAGTAESSRLQYTVNSTSSLNYKVQPSCNDNEEVLPEDDPAGSKHVGVCYDWW